MKKQLRAGIDLGGTKIEIAVLDDANKELVRRRRWTPRGDYRATLDTIADMVWEAERELEVDLTVGVSMPGSFSPITGLSRNANSTWIIGRDFDRDLSNKLGRRVLFANDADCFALSEANDGAARDAAMVFGVIIGTGVGGGVVINKKLTRGANNITGEWGHNPLPWLDEQREPGSQCYCGKKGCIETYLSGPGMSDHHFRRCGQKLSAVDIVRRAHQQDADCQDSLAMYCHQLARGLSLVINIFDPQVIVLGGGLSNVEQLYSEVPKILPKYVFSDTMLTQIKPPVHGDSGGVRGAAMLHPKSTN